eukprot:CAMPEP_0115746468 /NCGR_PEP_ID=MMETSP0272-20121206/92654_1 /TAXON_ID=71861 /ORGANISM="Scrippsiella trochoidea, Strain CCMP3099" /LENGTH=55 /DNA_ID=CAMNT_0003191413 /DNA_START=126 /DNA_END=290 /DNA_ORIENTATION=+
MTFHPMRPRAGARFPSDTPNMIGCQLAASAAAAAGLATAAVAAPVAGGVAARATA